MNYAYYGAYKKTRDLAWLILKNENVSTIPVPVVDICTKLGVCVKNFDPKHGEKGMVINLFGKPHIFVDRKLSIPEKRYIIAHELGHLLLGHMKDFNMLMYYDYKPKKHDLEDDASSFATRLLSPACVINSCNCQTWQGIERLCGIPESIAKIRITRLRTLRNRNKFLSSNLEKEVFSNFESFIQNFNDNPNPDNE